MTAGQASEEVRRAVENRVKSINQQVRSRGTRVAKALRNAELDVLKGKRSGKIYRVPDTHGQEPNKATRELMKEYRHKLRDGQLYRASAPGEAPASRNGDLREHWSQGVDSRSSSNSSGGNTVSVVAYIESQEEYADYLENGKGMAPRPFVEKIKERAKPEIEKILKEPYV